MLFQDKDGLWRCKGRLANANIALTTRHPVLLPRQHCDSELSTANEIMNKEEAKSSPVKRRSASSVARDRMKACVVQLEDSDCES